MDIETMTALLKEHVDEQSLEAEETPPPPAADQHQEPPPPVSISAFPWSGREPFSPPTMGYPLPYLDVITVQSKRLLPVTRKELDAQRRNARTTRAKAATHDRPAVADDDDGDRLDHTEQDAVHALGLESSTEPELVDYGVTPENRAEVDFDAILRSVRLLVEPIALPDLIHTGVKWQRSEDPAADFKVTAPNHSFEETQVKLFYPTGAKNTNMREYIQDTIHRHKADGATSPFKCKTSQLGPSQSTPTLIGASTHASPAHTKSKSTNKTKKSGGKLSAYNHPHPTPSPQKNLMNTNGIAAGARLSGSVSTSGLLNPELTRQAKDVLAQLRANSNKINDLIGS